MAKKDVNEKESEYNSLLYAQRINAMLRCLKTIAQDDDFSPNDITGVINMLTKFCLEK